MARPSAATAENQQSASNDSATKQRIVVAGMGRTGVDYACAFAMHPFAEVVGFVEPRGDLRRFARGIGFGAPSEATLGRWLEKHACDSVVVSAPADEALAIVERAVAAGLGVLVHGLAACRARRRRASPPCSRGARSRPPPAPRPCSSPRSRAHAGAARSPPSA
jgi:hypothetical protein